MTSLGKRHVFGRNKGYLSAAGPQSRFLLFLLAVLVFYTLLLLVFEKLSEFLPLFVFLPIALVVLLLLVGISGTIYSHSIIGPLVRIRRCLNQMVEGDVNICLRLREADDPLLKDVARILTLLSDRRKNARASIHEASRDLAAGLQALERLVQAGADPEEFLKHLATLRRTLELIEKAMQPAGKGQD